MKAGDFRQEGREDFRKKRRKGKKRKGRTTDGMEKKGDRRGSQRTDLGDQESAKVETSTTPKNRFSSLRKKICCKKRARP